MKTTLLRFAFLIFAVFAVRFSSQAQNNASDAHLFGTLLDSSGAGVGDVQIAARLEAGSDAQFWKATSSTDGAYSLSVPPGRYRVSFQRAPFVVREFIFDLAANQQRRLDLAFQLERLSSRVVVTAQAEPTLAEQTTAPVSIITKNEIAERQSVGLADLLPFATGIAIGRTGAEGGSASVFLNGGNSNFTKVLVDGAPINPPGGAVDFSSLTLDNIDKVEIVRGAEGAIYGTDAVSGAIQLFTHRGETRIPEFSVYGEGGSFASGRGGAQLSGLLGPLDYSAAASYFETDGQGPNDAFLNRTFSGNFGYTLNDSNQLRLTLRDNDSIAGIPGQTLYTPPSLHQRYKQHLFSSSARWNFSTGEHWHHQISGAESYTWQDTNNPIQSFFATDPNAFCAQTNPSAVPTAEFCDPTGDSRFQYNRANVTAQSSYLLSNFGVTAGYEYEVENAFLTSINVPHARRNNQAGFLDFRYRPHPRASLNFGARAEANSYFGTRVVPRAGASLMLLYGRGWRGDTLLRVFYGQGIKEPRFDQIFGDNFGDFGNPSLKPEASKTWTTGIEQKFLRDRIRINAEYFSSRFYDVVSFEFCTPDAANPSGNSCAVVLPGNPISFGYFFNTDLARARGLNLTGETHFKRWLNLAGNYTYDDTLVIKSPNAFDPSEVAGNHLIRRPVNSGSLTLNTAIRRLSFTLGGYFSGIRTDSDFLGLGFTRNPGYARFDLSGSYNVGRGVSFHARATNLFDKQYQDALGYPALGRDLRAGLKYTFSGRN
ncbi:MAG TPA: TonB-dependent receptor [Candidatus Methylomirabilis sp.]|nr:TonB-dependent receptor [Candidatus Methylomirabilis sp.]